MSLADVDGLFLDVDGVLTDGHIIINDEGVETKCFNVQDGTGIFLAREAGLQIAFITGRSSEVVARRAREFSIEELHLGVRNKAEVAEEILGRWELGWDRVAAVTDDITDIPLLRKAGVAIAVANAAEEVKAIADHVTTRSGGNGAVREIIEWILKAKGTWEGLLAERLGI